MLAALSSRRPFRLETGTLLECASCNSFRHISSPGALGVDGWGTGREGWGEGRGGGKGEGGKEGGGFEFDLVCLLIGMHGEDRYQVLLIGG